MIAHRSKKGDLKSPLREVLMAFPQIGFNPDSFAVRHCAGITFHALSFLLFLPGHAITSSKVSRINVVLLVFPCIA
jgi:hypothetical protein